MIDEAMGKILGMAMAYGVSALGLFLAYVNYRKRTLRAERVMTPAAWGVVLVVVVTIVAGVLVVAELAAPPAESVEPESLAAVEERAAPAAIAPAPPPATPAADARAEEERARWPLIGILVPALIFLVATWITAALYRHFSRSDGAPPAPETTEGGPRSPGF